VLTDIPHCSTVQMKSVWRRSYVALGEIDTCRRSNKGNCFNVS